MGAAFDPFQTLSALFLIFTTILTLLTPFILGDDTATTSPPPDLFADHYVKPFKSNTNVLVGALTTTFSLTLLFLLYIKHCNDARDYSASVTDSDPSRGSKNSGVNHALLESLPVFQFGSLKGQHSLDCAVCLAVFEDSEVLRLLPKCRHAFHVECVDVWLHAHSTCPLCRYKVEPDEEGAKAKSSEEESNIRDRNDAAWRGENENAEMASLDSAERGLQHRFDGVQQRWSDFEGREELRLTSETVTWEARGKGLRRSHSSSDVVGEVMERRE
ncbi:unnamed protein product [Sphenostylis stenocarpa]|uniref:RING-type E3 ubiquitin transferase n=1 Tax=Sphenostylis stenocarpa TaxID=92480 RepID=A0AA86SVL2_9FABA|nr:unnamed protein product [Sphenostylis stenocarpa]